MNTRNLTKHGAMNYEPQDGFPYYHGLVEDRDHRALFSATTTFDFLNALNDEVGNYRYAPDKWSLNQVVGHITDHERIKIFRAFFLSRNQDVALWGYDQNSLVDHSRFDELSLTQLVHDFYQVRQASLSFINTLSEAQLAYRGYANGHRITLNSFLKSIIGHELHHVNVIKTRYLPA